MPCTSPIDGYRKYGGGFTQNVKDSTSIRMTIPCGRCIGCRLDYSRDWAVRIMHESKSHKHNCFITLTYAPEHLPPTGTLVKKHFQDFMKRLRKKYSNHKISYFHCGEYGAKRGRPHYHAILFGIDFTNPLFDPNVQKSKRRDSGANSYDSPNLTKIWGKGITDVGNTTFKSAAYVARYITKKIHGNDAHKHYELPDTINTETGEIEHLLPEYVTMSLKIPDHDNPEKHHGIGANFYRQYKNDIFQTGQIVIAHDINSKPFTCRVPRYYTKLLEQDDPTLYEKYKERNLEFLKNKHIHEREHGKPSLDSIEKNIKARSSKLIRTYEENGND